MKLYSLPLSPFAARARCAIYAGDLPVEVLTPSPDWRTSGEIARLNPMNKLPVLVLDDGMALPESGVIIDYLDRMFALGLIPADPLAAARARLVAQVVEAYVGPAIMPLFMALDPKGGFDAEANSGLIDALTKALGHLEAVLEPGPFASGGRLTLADAYMTPLHFSLTSLSQLIGRPELLDAFPKVAAYPQTIEAHPALARVRQEMAEALESFLAGWRRTGDPEAASQATHA